MPNWVLTKIHGSEKALNKIKEIAVVHIVLEEKDVERPDGTTYHQRAQEYDEFDFEKIIPMPPHIYRGNLGREEEEKYGKQNCWYDWSCSHWGTKWNSSEYEEGDGYISFETARSVPFPVIVELSKFIPDEKLFVEFADEALGNNNSGRFYIQNGKTEEVEEELALSDEELWFAVRQNVPDNECKLAREEMKKEFEDEKVCDECGEVHSEDNDKNSTKEEQLPF